ncbi:MAG: hypothetical protein LAT55_08020 [Opitutales bacterium]|nr:hypothetical protein [Opitutales bacterium]
MNHIPVLIPMVLLLGSMFAVFGRRSQENYLPFLIALGAMGLSAVFSIIGMVYSVTEGPIHYHLGGWQPPMGIELILDPLAAFFCLMITLVATVVLLHGEERVRIEVGDRIPAYYSSALMLVGGLTGIVLTGDLFNLYVFLEISSLASYALLATGRKPAAVSAFRYLILGTIGASLYLLGIGFLFMEVGSLNMSELAVMIPEVPVTAGLSAAAVLIVIGIGLKMALFPLHGWLPDAYTFASSPATTLVAPIGTKVAAYVLIRVFLFLFALDFMKEGIHLTTIVGWMGAAGVIWGSVMAITQRDMKRMLAYSSVAQVGYIALGIGLANPLGLIGAVLHAFAHCFMKACLFMVQTNFLHRLGHYDISRLDHRTRVAMPWTCAALVVASLSMIGLPPTIGFFSKWYLVLGCVEEGAWIFLAVLLLSTLLNAVYFFRVLEKVYLRSDGKAYDEGDIEADQATPSCEVGARMLYPTLVLAGSLLVLGFANAWIVAHFLQPMFPVW